MKLLSKELVLRYQGGRDAVPGFVTYISRRDPVLMHCYGWQDYSDAYDNYVITLSRDNGRSWSEPVLQWQSALAPEGKIRYSEPAAFFDPVSEKLLTFTNRLLYPGDQLDVDHEGCVEVQTYDPGSNSWSPREMLELPGRRVPTVSFCVPLMTSQGRLIVPGQANLLDEAGQPVHYRGCWCPAGTIINLLGDRGEGGQWRWQTSRPVAPDLERTSRGHYEPTLAELPGGRLVMVLRGDNSMYPERPGYKWVSFSEDHGETWSAPEPLAFTGDALIESGSNGSRLLRSGRSGKLYWIGNLCLPGQRPKGNAPRSSLSILEVQEEPFALQTESWFVVDEKGFNDSPDLMLSNFRCYEDRQTGDIAIYVCRLGEKGMSNWQEGDYYRYRVEVC